MRMGYIQLTPGSIGAKPSTTTISDADATGCAGGMGKETHDDRSSTPLTYPLRNDGPWMAELGLPQ